jgi:DNA-binding response OmpR family regulator
MAILLIEDDKNIAASLSLSLEREGFKVESEHDGRCGLQAAENGNYELILLDCNLPSLSGFEVLRRLRAADNQVPVIILTVLGEVNDKLELFQAGADDYLVKPFAFSELLARIRALGRRPRQLCGKVLRLGDLELDRERFSVKSSGQKVSLPRREFDILEYLMKNPGRYISRQELMDNIWNDCLDVFSNTLEVHIMNIRKKIEQGGQRYIFNAATRGYKADLEK